MITNLNVRVLGNNAILVQYQKDGKAMDSGFNSWKEFVMWLKEELKL